MHKITVGVFDSSRALLTAAQAARKQGLVLYDAYSPFPVHGMDEALGISSSRLTAVCLAFGLAGLVLAFGFQEWVFLFSWPMNIGGKPYNAWPAYLPVTFELSVLLAGVGTTLVFLFWRRLNPAKKPALAGLGATNDRFLLALEYGSEEGQAALRRFFESQDALEIHEAQAL